MISLPSPEPDKPAWYPMERHVGLCLAAHPYLGGIPVHVVADENGIIVRVVERRLYLEARLHASGWWRPETLERSEEITEILAQQLRTRWLGMFSLNGSSPTHSYG